MKFLQKKTRKNIVSSKFISTFALAIRERVATIILGYGVMVTLQILVLSFLVRVRVSQLSTIRGEAFSSTSFFLRHTFYSKLKVT